MPFSFTTGYTKNIIRRAFREIIDKPPSRQQAESIWDFFNSECAYCGKKLQKTNKEGHLDHLVSASRGGWNHISNRVLSCASCNEQEKLDSPWKEFLASKVPDSAIMDIRRQKIETWQKLNLAEKDENFWSLSSTADQFAGEVVDYFDAKVLELRTQKKNLKI